MCVVKEQMLCCLKTSSIGIVTCFYAPLRLLGVFWTPFLLRLEVCRFLVFNLF